MARSSSRSLLVLNTGSSSIKYAMLADGRVSHRGSIEQLKNQAALVQAINRILTQTEERYGQPGYVAHRVVHAGGRWWKPTRLTPAVQKQLRSLIPLAPLHLPANLAGVAAVSKRWPSSQQIGVFDTGAFHHLPEQSRYYSIPLSLARKYGIRKYGFHGISHADTFKRASKRLKRRLNSSSGVTIHLGAGDSVAAWQNGRPVDTSMGFTPLEGLTMATRSGDLDPTIPLYLQTHAKLSVQAVAKLLQQQSGLFGLTGLKDIRDVFGAAGHRVPGQPKKKWTSVQSHHAQRAVKMFIYDVQRYLASYLGTLREPAFVAFTGAVGQNAWVRKEVLRGVTMPRGVRVVTLSADEERAIAEAVLPMVH